MSETMPDALHPSAPPSRRAELIRRISIAVLVVGLLAIVKVLPLGRGLDELRGWVDGLGYTGMLVFALAYVAAALLFVPGGALTLAAGALFGLAWGTAIVSVASTTAAALGHLIARHLARGKIEALARRYPRFRAVDQAIGERGWKIVFLLRLSPAFPYSASNYFYGLTAVRLWPQVIASWVAMLPGTFMYVYLGHAGTAAVEGGRSTGEWVLLVVGLVATIAVTVYVTRIAMKALRRESIENDTGQEDRDVAEKGASSPGPSLASNLVTAGLALAVLAAAVLAYRYEDELQNLFGPPVVTLRETYESDTPSAAFDHSALDALLRERVDEHGLVDYAGLAGRPDADRLDAYLAALQDVDFDALGRDQKLALLINAYNAFTLRLVLDHFPIASIRDLPSDRRWDDRRWNLAGRTFSLNELEHEGIRPNFREPRVHFALVCAAIGCPPLRNEAYVAERLDEQLAEQAARVHAHERWFRFDEQSGVVQLTPLYDWYGNDFAQVEGSVLEYAALHSPALAESLALGRTPTTEWLPYDWSLNTQDASP